MEGFAPNQEYNEGNPPFLHPSYLAYARESYGYCQFPHSYPYGHVPSDLLWSQSPMYAPNPYMIPHSCCMDMGYIPPLSLPNYFTKPPGRGRSSSKTRPSRRSRGGSQPCSSNQSFASVPNDRGYLYQTPQLPNGYMTKGLHDFSKPVHRSFPPERLNPYAYSPYQCNNECLSADFSKGNLDRDIVSEAMEESGIVEIDSSSEIPSNNEADKSRDVTKDGEMRSVCEQNNTHQIDLTPSSFNLTDNGYPSSMYFPELQHHNNVNSSPEELKSSSSKDALPTQNKSFASDSPFITDAQNETHKQSIGQVSRSMYLTKQISSDSSLELQSSCSTTAEKEEKHFLSVLSTTDVNKDNNVLLINQNQSTLPQSDCPSTTNCENTESFLQILSPLNTSKNSFDILDLSDLPSLEDIALDFNAGSDNCFNDISIESLINSVNELCQLEGTENNGGIGSYYLTETDGKIIFELHEDNDKGQNAGTGESQSVTNTDKKYISSVLLYEAQDANCQFEKLGEFRTHCTDEINEVHPNAKLLHIPDVDVPVNIHDDDTRSGSTASEATVFNLIRVENDCQQVPTTEFTFGRQNGNHSKDVTKPYVQFEPEYHLIAFTPDSNTRQVSELNAASSSAVPENTVGESFDEIQESKESGGKTKSLRGTETSKHDKLQKKVRKEKKKHQHKSKKQVDPAIKECTKRTKYRLKSDRFEANKDSFHIEDNKLPLKRGSPNSNKDLESPNCLKAFIRNFDDFDEEVANLMTTVQPNQVWSPVSTESQNSNRMGEDVFHASVVEMASLCDATISTVQSASESLLQSTGKTPNQEDVDVIEDVGSVQIFPEQEIDNGNLVTLSVELDDFEKILLEEEENVLENACKMSRSCCKERGQNSSAYPPCDFFRSDSEST